MNSLKFLSNDVLQMMFKPPWKVSWLTMKVTPLLLLLTTHKYPSLTLTGDNSWRAASSLTP